mmetsp:Transcript_104039/g.294460  ORF Transcript_104039/g.294460 Transcript_104039/m.294460 type:complete len:426 (+) Transcript_104039:62-1339(+)
MGPLSRLLPLPLFLEPVTGMMTRRQTPEELGFAVGDGDPADAASDPHSRWPTNFGAEQCLDLGAKGFPLPVFNMLREANWDPQRYFDALQAKGYGEDALQLVGPQNAIMKSDCMRPRAVSRIKHIFVGDSQMMTLRNALHRLNRCPEIYFDNSTTEELISRRRSGEEQERRGRLHSGTLQSPEGHRVPKGCTEEGIASFIHWDAWHYGLPLREIQSEISDLGLDTAQDTVVVWVGSNYIRRSARTGVFYSTVQALHDMKVKMVWDTPTYQDVALMAATSTHHQGMDRGVPIVYTSISMRKAHGEIGSNEYRDEKKILAEAIPMTEVPMTKRWQLTNRYRGLQCDGIHTDMRGRDPLFYDQPCPYGEAPAYGTSSYCMWTEPFQQELSESCPAATGVDDLVLQSGLYSMCAAHEKPFCYSYTEHIR